MEQKPSLETDQVMPKDKWEFNKEVAEVFEDMLQRSIPQYEVMRDLSFRIGQHFIKDKGTIVDLGCSDGQALSYFVNRYGSQLKYVGIEISEPMVEVAQRRFAGYIQDKTVTIIRDDLRAIAFDWYADLVLSILTIMFVPIEYRQDLLYQTYEHLRHDGALIIIEKVLGNTGLLDRIMVDEYYQMKRESGYTDEQIERKKLSLEGVLVPVTAKWNEEMLRNAGFRQIDCFWRALNFTGWIAIK